MYTGRKAHTRTKNRRTQSGSNRVDKTPWSCRIHITKYILTFEKTSVVMQFVSDQIEFLSVASTRKILHRTFPHWVYYIRNVTLQLLIMVSPHFTISKDRDKKILLKISLFVKDFKRNPCTSYSEENSMISGSPCKIHKSLSKVDAIHLISSCWYQTIRYKIFIYGHFIFNFKLRQL